MNLQPVLGNALVALRPLAPEDWDALYAAASDPLIWAGHPAHDRWREPVFRAFFAAALASGGAMLVTDAASGAVIGSSRYDRERVMPGEIEIGWSFLVRSVWGGKVNAAVKGLMIRHALTLFERAVFMVGEDNRRSRRAMEKIGGRLTDRIMETDLGAGPVRHVVFAIDRVGFAAGPLAGL